MDTGLRTTHTVMTVKLTENSKEVNAVKVRITKKDGSIKRLSDHLENESP
jgi:hypothetical protein